MRILLLTVLYGPRTAPEPPSELFHSSVAAPRQYNSNLGLPRSSVTLWWVGWMVSWLLVGWLIG